MGLTDSFHATLEEAQTAIAHYEANRCPCGGAPLWVENGMHAVAWHDEHGWPERTNEPRDLRPVINPASASGLA